MATDTAEKIVTGLVLQGGGALGAFELGAIECLLENGKRPDIVSGVSIGAINAAVLCGYRDSDPQTSLRKLWDDLTTLSIPFQTDAANRNMSVFGCPGMYQLRTDFWNFPHWTSFYDTSPLINTLEKHIDFNKLKKGQSDTRLILTATNIHTGKLEQFDSEDMDITPNHILASGSLPPGFPATKALAPPHTGGVYHTYWDGGLFDNTPLSMVINALEKCNVTKRNLYVISLFPSASVSTPETMNDVFARMVTLAFSNKMSNDLQRAKETTGLIEFVRELDKLIIAGGNNPALNQLTKLPGYQVLKDIMDKKIIDIIEIENISASGAADFSAAGIERRREAGYQATLAKII